MNDTLPSHDALRIESLTDYVDIVTRMLIGNLNSDEKKQKTIIRGQLTTEHILNEIGSVRLSEIYTGNPSSNFGNSTVNKAEKSKTPDRLTVIDRVKLYGEYTNRRPQYKSVKDITEASYVFYRGQSNAKYHLTPSVFRKDAILRSEDYIYHEVMVRCPEYFKDASHLDKLVIMQHFGTSTRLLDISSNPLVALYFACQLSSTKKEDGAEPDGRVFVFGLKKEQVVYSDSDRVLMLSCLPKFSYDHKMKMLETTYKRIKSLSFELTKGRGSDRPYYDEIEKFYHEVTTEQPSFKREIKPIDLVNPIFVKPSKSNPRILKQDGAFILSGLNETALEAEQKIKNYVHLWIAVAGDKKREILNELDAMGINKASLFPDLESTGKYLKEKI